MATLSAVAWSAARIAAGVYVGLGGILFFRQSSMLFYPTRQIDDSPDRYGMAFESVTIDTPDGEKLGAWYVPAADARGSILMCHGNGGNIGHRVQAIRFFHDLKLNVLIFDYRGYGTSSGKPSERGLYTDAQAAWSYLTRTRGARANQTVVFGRSLGGAVAAWLARQEKPAALVIEASFTSVPDMAAKLYPYLPVRLLCRYKFTTRDYLRKATCPVLVAHSPADDLIPYAHGRALFDAAPAPKVFVELTGGHNDGESFFAESYRQKLDEFFAAALPASRDRP